MLRILFVFALFAALLSCNTESSKKSTDNVKITSDTLRLELKQANDSISHYWKLLIDTDDKMISYTKRLLDEISYTPQYDVQKHGYLRTLQAQLPSKRYTQDEMVDPDAITKYDNATDSLVNGVKSLVASTPQVERYPLCNELVNDITFLYNNAVPLRVKYDEWALKLNTLLETYPAEIKNLGTPYSTWKKRGLFQLPG